MYKQTKPFFDGAQQTSVIRTLDNAFIPFDTNNVDYIAYLKWVEEGGVPLPADGA